MSMDESLTRPAGATWSSGQASEARVSGTLLSEQPPASPMRSEAGRAPEHKSCLLRHDILITWNTLRATFGRWQDRLMAAIMLVAALAVTRTLLGSQNWTTAAWAALLAGMLLAFERVA